MNRMYHLISVGGICVLLLAAFSPQSPQAQAAPAINSLYAIPGGDPANPCTISFPCSLDEAMAHAVDGNTIYLGEGTYTHYAHQNLIDLDKNVNIFGGWYGNVGIPPFVTPLRDPVNHPSILDGQMSRRGMYIHGGVTPIIDGIKFINGRANVYQADLCGGGLQNNAHGCGAGIFIYQSAPAIQNCVFYDNRAVRVDIPADQMGYGGAIFVESPTGQVLLQHNIFDNNRATDVNDGKGAAIAIHGTGATGSVTIWDNLFKDNVATFEGGAISAEYFQGSSLLIQDNHFEANHALIAGAAINLDYVDHAIVYHNWFQGQRGNIGSFDNGTVDARYSGLNFASNSMIDNEPDYALKIMFYRTHYPQVTNNLFVRSGRVATIGVLGDGWDGQQNGFVTMEARLKHNTLVQDWTSQTIGIFARSIRCHINASTCAYVILENNILFRYNTGLSAPSSEQGQIKAYYTLFYQVTNKTDGGYVLMYNEVIQPYAGFKDYLNDDYHLVRNAPARDKGMNAGVTVDFEGDPRPLGGGYDLGYDEFAVRTWLPAVKK